MLVGVPREIKNHEYRIGITSAGVRELTGRGHQVLVERDGGAGVGISNDDYRAAGAAIVGSASEIFGRAEMIVKVKEPQPEECKMLRSGQILFTYLHLAPDPAQTELLVASGASCIAYETVTDRQGGLPLLAPMSEVAGRMSVQEAAHCLEKAQGGSGILLGGSPRCRSGKHTGDWRWCSRYKRRPDCRWYGCPGYGYRSVTDPFETNRRIIWRSPKYSVFDN